MGIWQLPAFRSMWAWKTDNSGPYRKSYRKHFVMWTQAWPSPYLALCPVIWQRQGLEEIISEGICQLRCLMCSSFSSVSVPLPPEGTRDPVDPYCSKVGSQTSGKSIKWPILGWHGLKKSIKKSNNLRTAIKRSHFFVKMINVPSRVKCLYWTYIP